MAKNVLNNLYIVLCIVLFQFFVQYLYIYFVQLGNIDIHIVAAALSQPSNVEGRLYWS